MAFSVIETVGGMNRFKGCVAVISRVVDFRGREYYVPVVVFYLVRWSGIRR